MKKTKIKSNMPDLFPFTDRIDDHFLMKNGIHMDIYQIRTFDLDSLSASDRDYMISLWARFYQVYSDDIKIIAMNCATDTTNQQMYYRHKRDLNHNPVYQDFLTEEIEQLEGVSANRLDRLYYLMTFADNEEDYKNNCYIIQNRLIHNGLADYLSYQDKLDVIHKQGNKILTGTQETYYSVSVSQDEQAAETKKKGYNPYIIADIQPAGGITFDVSRYIRTGSGYEACITLYKYPPKVGLYWLIPLLGINRSIVTIDINTQDPSETKKNLNESIRENESRLSTSSILTDADAAAQRIDEYRQIYAEINNQGQVNKMIVTRIYLYAATYQQIDQITGSVIERLESNAYRAAVYLNECKSDWTAQYQSYTQQSKTIYSRTGQPVLSYTLAKGLPYYFTNIDDPHGLLIGTTNSNQGTALLDIFHKTSTRLSYNGLIVGSMGSGKSTTAKKLLLDNAIRGNYLRIIDPSGEYETLVAALGGYSISLDGTNGILNALEILKTAETEGLCWVNHVSKMVTSYRLIAPDADDAECNEFEVQLLQFYADYGIIDIDRDLSEQQLSGLDAAAYPTWSDLYNYINQLLSKITAPKDAVQREITIIKVRRLESIKLHISTLIQNYGYLVDGHTSVTNALDARILTFNTAGLTKVKPEIFDLQIFLALQLAWDNCVQIGTKMKDLYDRNQIQWEDITRFLVIIDESHRFLNAQKLSVIQQAIIIQREARKYFGGLWLASQSIRDFVPEGSDAAGVNEIKKLFELCQYKFLFRQDVNAVNMLSSIFRSSLSENDIDTIPRLEVGHAILCIGSERKVQLNIEITERERHLFTGGA